MCTWVGESPQVVQYNLSMQQATVITVINLRFSAGIDTAFVHMHVCIAPYIRLLKFNIQCNKFPRHQIQGVWREIVVVLNNSATKN